MVRQASYVEKSDSHLHNSEKGCHGFSKLTLKREDAMKKGEGQELNFEGHQSREYDFRFSV